MALEVFPQPTEHLEKGGVHCTAVPAQGPRSTLVLGLGALARLMGAQQQQTRMSPEHATLARKA